MFLRLATVLTAHRDVVPQHYESASAGAADVRVHLSQLAWPSGSPLLPVPWATLFTPIYRRAP